MYQEVILGLIGAARKKEKMLDSSIMRYLLVGALAGFFVGIGILMMILSQEIFSSLSIPVVKIINGFVFTMALSFVMFAGGDLYTGNVIATTVGYYHKKIKFSSVLKLLLFSYIGNLIGSILISFLFSMTHPSESFQEAAINLANTKTGYTMSSILFKGIFCNIMVCLAVLLCARPISDSSKLILIFWCILAFVSLGGEHSVANMTCFSLAKILEPSYPISLFIKNLIPATVGNYIGGAGIGLVYCLLNTTKPDEI